MGEIRCPTLLVSGEYDPRAPLDEVYRLFDQITAPAELWVCPDQHHTTSLTLAPRNQVWEGDINSFVCDWLRDRFNGLPVKYPGQVLYLDANGAGPNSQTVTLKRRWFD